MCLFHSSWSRSTTFSKNSECRQSNKDINNHWQINNHEKESVVNRDALKLTLLSGSGICQMWLHNVIMNLKVPFGFFLCVLEVWETCSIYFLSQKTQAQFINILNCALFTCLPACSFGLIGGLQTSLKVRDVDLLRGNLLQPRVSAEHTNKTGAHS